MCGGGGTVYIVMDVSIHFYTSILHLSSSGARRVALFSTHSPTACRMTNLASGLFTAAGLFTASGAAVACGYETRDEYMRLTRANG